VFVEFMAGAVIEGSSRDGFGGEGRGSAGVGEDFVADLGGEEGEEEGLGLWVYGEFEEFGR
jgi:hypothetical protein